MCALRQLHGFISSCTIYYSEAKSNYTYFIDLSYTAELEQCVSKAEFDRVVTQMAADTAAVQSELNTWQNATIHILKRFLLDNPGKKICGKHRALVVVVM